MAGRPKTKMTIENRAKQFMPFAALKGLPEAMAAKEKIVVEKIELSGDMEEELDRKMRSLEKGTIATVIYFEKDEYQKITGMVAKIDRDSRVLQIIWVILIVVTLLYTTSIGKICFENIYSLDYTMD